MAIFSGVVAKAGELVSSGLNSIGFDWATGAAAAALTTPISIGFQVDDIAGGGVPPTYHIGGFTLNVPNHSPEFGTLAINMAQETLALIELAVALQAISDPKGGIKIKDALDPYHYNVVKSALEENGEPVPEVANPGATTLTKLGGSIIETGALSGVGVAFDAMQTAGFGSEFLKFTPAIMPTPAGIGVGASAFGFRPSGAAGTPIYVDVIGNFPTLSLPLAIMNSAISIRTALMQYIVGLFRNSIDASAGALLLKHVLDDFSVEVSKNAIEKSRGPAAVPNSDVQVGEDGVF